MIHSNANRMNSYPEPIAKIIWQCGDNLWNSCAQYPRTEWQHEVENGDTVLGYWEWVASQAESDGTSLETLTGDTSSLDLLDQIAAARSWSAEEVRHAKDNLGVFYGPEAIVALENGRQIRTPPFPGLCSYVRVVDAGFELAFWEMDEFKDNPGGVLGALISAAKGSPSHQCPIPRQSADNARP